MVFLFLLLFTFPTPDYIMATGCLSLHVIPAPSRETEDNSQVQKYDRDYGDLSSPDEIENKQHGVRARLGDVSYGSKILTYK